MLPAFSSASIHLGSTSEKKMEKPRTNRFLVEFRSTNCRLERPTWIYLLATRSRELGRVHECLSW